MVGHVGNSYRPHNFCPTPNGAATISIKYKGDRSHGPVGKSRQESARVKKILLICLFASLLICLFAYLLLCLFEGEEKEEDARTMEGVSENAR